MKRSVWAGSGLLLLVGAVAGPHSAAAQHAAAESSPRLAVAAEAAVVSRYLWRGYDLSRGRPAAQLAVSARLFGTVELGAFASTALDSRTQLDEYQVGLSYRRTVAGFEWTAGYVAYVAPGTQTEAASASGEWTVALSVPVATGSVTVAYARGHGDGVGNSLNLWLERPVALAGERAVLTPYLELDYFDAYGAPPPFEERLASVTAGAPLELSLGRAALVITAGVTLVPSAMIRASNIDAGSATRGPVPWLSVGVSF